MEIALNFILKLGLLGLGYYLVHSVFAKNTKEVHFSVDQNGIKFFSKFFKS